MNVAQRPNALSVREMLGGVWLVAGRELGAYFDSSIAYVHSIAFVVLANSIFMNEFFLSGRIDMLDFNLVIAYRIAL